VASTIDKTNIPGVRVLVAYEDLAAGRCAMEMLQRIGHQCGGASRLVHLMWRFDVLADSSCSELAANEALEADIIVIATREGDGLPQPVRDWIARWLLTKADRPTALVAALDHDRVPAGGQRRVRPYLEKLADCGKMQFFANGSGMVPSDSACKVDMR